MAPHPNFLKTDAELINEHRTLRENQNFIEKKKLELNGIPVKVTNENLLKYPRPTDDNRRGLHWSPNQSNWGREKLEYWLSEIKAMNLKWIKLYDTGSGTCHDLAIRLVDMEVMPVVRMHMKYPTKYLNWDVVKRYIDVGVVWFEFGNEPDLDDEWVGGKKPEGWLDMVVDRFIFHARECQNLGGYTLFDAFGQGTLINPFEKIVEKGGKDLFDGYIGLAIHNYCLGRPLSYPEDPIRHDGRQYSREEYDAAGGLNNDYAFTQSFESVNAAIKNDFKNLKQPITIMHDATCFRAYEYFSKLLHDVIGEKKIPIITTEGGYNTFQVDKEVKYPKLNPFLTSVAQKQMLDFVNLYASEEYFACMPWLAGDDVFGASGKYEDQGPYYTNKYKKDFGVSDKLPIVDKLKEDPGTIHDEGNVPAKWQELQEYKNNLGDREVDPRLFFLPKPVIIEPFDRKGPYWKIIKVEWRNKGERDSEKRTIYGKLLMDKSPIEGATFTVDRGDAQETGCTKGEIDGYWGNAMMTGSLGTYTVYSKEANLPSDKLIGVGLGSLVEGELKLGDSTTFFITFQKVTP